MKKVFFNKKVLCAHVVCILLGAVAFAKGPSVQTEIASIDNHGNANLKITGQVFTAKGFGLGDLVTVKAGKQKIDAPVGKNYTDVDSGACILRINGEEVSLAINRGNFAGQFGLAVGSSVSITMKERLGYLRTYQTRLLNKSTERADFSSDEVFANFRAVKAGAIAPNRLFRSTSPIETDSRAPFAARLAEAAGVAVVLNLADTAETAKERISSAPYYEQLSLSGNVYYGAMGASYTDADFAKKVHEALSFLAEKKGPYYIHGKEGRTRTGVVCALLEALCGATMDELCDDYMASYVNYYNVRSGTVQYGALMQAVPDFFKAINGGKDVTDKNLQAVTEKYLLKTVKLTEKQIEALRSNLQA